MDEQNVRELVAKILKNMMENPMWEPAISREDLYQIFGLIDGLVAERDAYKAISDDLFDATRPKPKPPVPPRPTPNEIVEKDLWSLPEKVFISLMALFIGSIVVMMTIMMWVAMWHFIAAGGSFK